MKSTCIAQCLGVIVFAATVEGFAQPPEGKGKPKHAGASPFIEFPVPQHSVGILHKAHIGPHGAVAAAKAVAFDIGKPHGLGKDTPGALAMNDKKSLEASLPMASGTFPVIKKDAAVPECISR